VLRQTIRQRLQAQLGEVKAELKRRLHDPVPEVDKWLRSVVEGHIRYYGVPMNFPALRPYPWRGFWATRISTPTMLDLAQYITPVCETAGW
jgi:hypothetical protein